MRYWISYQRFAAKEGENDKEVAIAYFFLILPLRLLRLDRFIKSLFFAHYPDF